MGKKASIEISASFLVVVILTIAFFSLSLYFGMRAMKGAGEYSDKLNEQTIAQVEGMLDTGHDSIVMSFKTKNVLRNEITLFALGIRNVVDPSGAAARDFKVVVATNQGKSTVSDNFDSWIKMTSGATNLQTQINPKQNRVISIGILPPSSASAGTYAFDVKVCYNDANVPNNDPDPPCDAAFPDFYSEPLLIKATLES